MPAYIDTVWLRHFVEMSRQQALISQASARRSCAQYHMRKDRLKTAMLAFNIAAKVKLGSGTAVLVSALLAKVGNAIARQSTLQDVGMLSLSQPCCCLGLLVSRFDSNIWFNTHENSLDGEDVWLRGC